ncbi:hypothetical protein QUW38_04055 [Clostridium butyricum]|uniref:hypothetical protein n=1 Tax=Clostridium butyricum TaxID=1492 RepID=UPI0025A41942|nr:hypothetical protein [Clostridium butyricum]MDM8129961.1 hypothetical protein [Clostridium butyricum]MDM8228623.1 hypothetical protein [Clostridium butyricum]
MRAVIGDHILFDECIDSFRENDNGFGFETYRDEEKISYIMTDFVIEDDIEVGDIHIYKSIEVSLPNAYSGFVSKIRLPKWVVYNSESLFATALSSVMSFYTGRSIKSPRDNYFHNREITHDELIGLAIKNPILVAGPGAVNRYISKTDLEVMMKDLNDIIKLLWKIPIDRYREFMYAIRLSALSIYNLRTDFALGYYLMASSIESIAQIAIKRKSKKHFCESKWSERAKVDPEFNIVFQAYKNERGNNKYLSERFAQFILKYCPIREWKELKHPMEELLKTPYENSFDYRWVTKKRWDDIYPEDLTEEEVKELLKETYDYRSRFTHLGKNPPHKSPNDTMNRFFEVVHEYNDNTYRDIVLINYRLLSFINRKAIINYLEEISKK